MSPPAWYIISPQTERCTLLYYRNMGCTSFVPGTHRIKEEPRSVWESGVPSSTKDSNHDAHTAFQGQSELPHVRFSGKAGDCCIMDLRTWHTAMENTTDRDRYRHCPSSVRCEFIRVRAKIERSSTIWPKYDCVVDTQLLLASTAGVSRGKEKEWQR